MKLIVYTPLQLSFDSILNREGMNLVDKVRKSIEGLQDSNKMSFENVVKKVDNTIDNLVLLNKHFKIFMGKKLL